MVGESENIQASMIAHLQRRNWVLMELNPTGFSFELCGKDERALLKEMLVRDLNPVANIQPGPAYNYDAYPFQWSE